MMTTESNREIERMSFGLLAELGQRGHQLEPLPQAAAATRRVSSFPKRCILVCAGCTLAAFWLLDAVLSALMILDTADSTFPRCRKVTFRKDHDAI